MSRPIPNRESFILTLLSKDFDVFARHVRKAHILNAILIEITQRWQALAFPENSSWISYDSADFLCFCKFDWIIAGWVVSAEILLS